MSEDVPLSPSLQGLDPEVDAKSAATEAIDGLKDAGRRARDAVEAARQPGMPLSVLSNMAREAPLGSLLIAFLLGIAVGRRTR